MDNDKQFFIIDPQSYIDYQMGKYQDSILRKAESIIFTRSKGLRVYIRRYSSQMIDGMYFALGFSGREQKDRKIDAIAEKVCKEAKSITHNLPADAYEALRLVFDKGGIMLYNSLESKYHDSRTIFWNEHPPKSPMEVLKMNGLIMVCTDVKSGRKYKMAAIPADVMDSLKGVFDKLNSDPVKKQQSIEK